MKARITQARVTFGFDPKPEVVMTKQWIGIDVSKKRLDIYIRPTGEAFSCDNTPAEIAQLVERLTTLCFCLPVPERSSHSATSDNF